jgi:hypothetical protein
VAVTLDDERSLPDEEATVLLEPRHAAENALVDKGGRAPLERLLDLGAGAANDGAQMT